MNKQWINLSTGYYNLTNILWIEPRSEGACLLHFVNGDMTLIEGREAEQLRRFMRLLSHNLLSHNLQPGEEVS